MFSAIFDGLWAAIMQQIVAAFTQLIQQIFPNFGG